MATYYDPSGQPVEVSRLATYANLGLLFDANVNLIDPTQIRSFGGNWQGDA